MDIKQNAINMASYKKPDKRFGVRHFQTCLLFFGMFSMILVKVDMNLAIVAMTDASQNNTFDWTHQRQSVILSSYKWGYIFSKIPGGELSARFGGKVVLVGCGVINSVIGLLVPTAAYFGGWQVLCFCRLVQGLSQGVVLPAIQSLIGKWAPQEERSTIGSVLYSGGELGTAIEFMIAGTLASYWGWPAIFYFNGIVLMIWTLVYVIFGSSSPQNSKKIGEEERLYIQNSLGQVDGRKRVKTPWKALLTSVPFIALVIGHAGNGWGYWTLLTEMPTYFNKVLGVNIRNNGFITALPYLASSVTTILFGLLADYILAKGWIGITACRKINNTVGTFGPGFLLIGVSFVTTDITVAVALLTTCVAVSSAAYSGYNLVHLDMSPNHAGTMFGISGAVSNVASTFAPLAAGFLIQDETLSSEWRKIFNLAAGILIGTNIIFLLFSTSRRQKWNDSPDEPAGCRQTEIEIRKDKDRTDNNEIKCVVSDKELTDGTHKVDDRA